MKVVIVFDIDNADFRLEDEAPSRTMYRGSHEVSCVLHTLANDIDYGVLQAGFEKNIMDLSGNSIGKMTVKNGEVK